jgi:hypothetical protein
VSCGGGGERAVKITSEAGFRAARWSENVFLRPGNMRVNDYAYRCAAYQDSTHFFGYHRTDHKLLNTGDNGIDILEAKTLKNGWIFDFMDLVETQKDDGRVDWVDGFKSGSDRTTTNVRWSTGRQGSIYYLLRLFIKGPAGMPFGD